MELEGESVSESNMEAMSTINFSGLAHMLSHHSLEPRWHMASLANS